MARHSSLPVPQGAYFVKIYRYLVDMFNGDVCCAIIISILDFLTIGKMDALEAAGETEGLLWIEISLNRLAEDMCGLYASRMIQERLAFLICQHIIEVPTGQELWGRDHSKPMHFLLARENIATLWRTGGFLEYQKTTHPEPTEMAAAKLQRVSANSFGSAPDLHGANIFAAEMAPLRVKVLEEQEQEQNIPPAPLNPNPNPQEKDLNLNSQHNPGESSEQVRAGVAGLKPPWRGPKRYREKPRKLGLTTLVQEEQEEMVTTEAETALGSNETASPSLTTPGLARRFLGLWNAVFPGDPVKWHPSYAHYPAFSDPDFEPDMTALCKKIKELCTSDAFFDYLTFKYVLGEKDGILVWPGVLQLKPRPKKSNGRPDPNETIRKALEALHDTKAVEADH